MPCLSQSNVTVHDYDTNRVRVGGARQRHSSSSLSSFSSGSVGVARVVVVVRAFGGPPPRVTMYPYMGCSPSCHVCVGHALMPVCVCACHAHAMPCVCSRTHRHSYHVRGSPANDHLAEHSSAPRKGTCQSRPRAQSRPTHSSYE